MPITKPPTPDRVPYLLNLAAAMLDEAQTTLERVPHDHECDCYDCSVERAQDTAREMR
jgi:hypothetical protein